MMLLNRTDAPCEDRKAYQSDSTICSAETVHGGPRVTMAFPLEALSQSFSSTQTDAKGRALDAVSFCARSLGFLK